MPWYEPDDFAQLLALAQDREHMPADYETWHRNASTVLNAWLARGRALQIVTIRPAAFLAWAEKRGLPNTAAARLQYVVERATCDCMAE